MSGVLDDSIHERFALAYAALELTSPGRKGNGSDAYRKVRPSASVKTAQNQATTYLQRRDVRDRVDALLLQGRGADHLVHAGAFIDDVLLDAIGRAREKNEPAVLLRAAELADRGRVGGARFVKELRRTGDNPFEGKTPEQITAMKRAALTHLGIDPDRWDEFERWRRMRTIPEATDEGAGEKPDGEARVGTERRRGGAVH